MVTHAKDIVDKMNKRVVAIDSGKIIRDYVGNYLSDADMIEKLSEATEITNATGEKIAQEKT